MMEKVRLWFLSFKDHVQHVIFAAVILVVVTIVLHFADVFGLSAPLLGGALAGIFFYFGREQRDAENADPQLMDQWRSLWPLTWGKDMRLDFFYPLFGNLALFAAWSVLSGVL